MGTICRRPQASDNARSLRFTWLYSCHRTPQVLNPADELEHLLEHLTGPMRLSRHRLIYEKTRKFCFDFPFEPYELRWTLSFVISGSLFDATNSLRPRWLHSD